MFPYLRQEASQTKTLKKLSMALGILCNSENEFRDNINKWFENTLASINNKKIEEKNEKNQVFLH